MKERKRRGWVKHVDFMLVDILCIELAYQLAYLFRRPSMFIYRGMSLYVHLNIILIVIDICYVIMRPVYKNIIKRSAAREFQSVLIHNLVMWMLAIVYLYLTQQAFWFSRSMMTLAIVFSVVFMFAGRLIWKKIVRQIVSNGRYQANILLVSSAEYSAKMIRRFRERVYNGFNLHGLAIIDAERMGDTIEGIPVVCGKENLLDYVLQEAIDDVMIAIPGNTQGNRELVYQLLNMGVVVHLAVDYVEDDFPHAEVERIGGFTFLSTSVNTMGNAATVVKRVIDIIAGLIGCAITGVLFLFIAPLIYRASPGPIFYRQERVGRSGRRFTLYKFRSMYPDADERRKELMKQNEMKGEIFKVKNDPRIIRNEKGPIKNVGDFIRKTSIDEFPQFFNILKGDMSLVGTRPPMVDEFENYDMHHKIRLSVKPGLTGLWQVSGRNQITDFEEIVRLDTEYIENWSLKLDLEIILKTFKVVIRRQGAE